MSVRTSLKFLIEQGARFSGVNRLSRWRHRHDVLVLAYHDIVPHGETVTGDRSLHLAQRVFADQLDLLLETHDVVPLRAAFDATHSSRPRVALTFDDAYRGAVTAGVEELRSRNLPATIFVAPRFVDGGAFWWDLLADASGLDSAVREHALSACAGRHDDVMEWARTNHLRTYDIPEYMTCADESQLAAALTYDGITLASHTWSHPNLSRLDGGALLQELRAPQQWLERFAGRTINAVTYPYGRANDAVWEAARTAGYDAGYMISGGWIVGPRGTDARPRDGHMPTPFTQPRLNISAGVSRQGFALRAAGMLTE